MNTEIASVVWYNNKYRLDVFITKLKELEVVNYINTNDLYYGVDLWARMLEGFLETRKFGILHRTVPNTSYLVMALNEPLTFAGHMEAVSAGREVKYSERPMALVRASSDFAEAFYCMTHVPLLRLGKCSPSLRTEYGRKRSSMVDLAFRISHDVQNAREETV